MAKKYVGNQSDRPFVKLFRELTYRHSPWPAWSDFIVLSACAISNAVDKEHRSEREALYMKTVSKYTKQELDIFPQLLAEMTLALEANPEQDFLGTLYMELNLGNDRGGQFFTPYSVCQLMAEITTGNVEEQIGEHGYITLNDCACGAGATLIAGINQIRKRLHDSGSKLNFQNHLLVTGQDIDYTTSLMCYIQISLLGVAGYIKIGDSLADPMHSGDKLDNYWFTPMYFSDVWTMRRLIRGRYIL